MGERDTSQSLEEKIKLTKEKILSNGASKEVRKILTEPFSSLGKYNYPPLESSERPKRAIVSKDNRS